MTLEQLKPVEYAPVNIYDIKSVNRDAYPLVAKIVDSKLYSRKDVEQAMADDKALISILENKVASLNAVIESQRGYMTRLKNEKRDENGEKRAAMINACMYAIDMMSQENGLMLAEHINGKAYEKLKERITEFITKNA